LPSSYFVTFKIKFKKKSGTEHVQIVKENGEWKVAACSFDIATWVTALLPFPARSGPEFYCLSVTPWAKKYSPAVTAARNETR
jgi:hypothetical protein